MLRIFHRMSGKVPSMQRIARRSASTSFQFVDIEDSPENGYSILKMQRKPVNSFNLEFISEMIEAIDSVEKNPSSRGLVITSPLKVYSAGLDITELYNPNEARLNDFWRSFQELNLRLHSTPLATIAAINGPSPAGGCAISLQCDYRIMADGKSIIGLNETLLGLAAPLWLCKIFAQVVGHRQAEMHLSLGTLMSPQQALGIGLVDALVPGEDLVSAVDTEMKKWLSIPELGRTRTKALMRKEYIDDFVNKREEDMQMFTGVVKDPKMQKVLTKYVEVLRNKSK